MIVYADEFQQVQAVEGEELTALVEQNNIIIQQNNMIIDGLKSINQLCGMLLICLITAMVYKILGSFIGRLLGRA